MRILLKSQAGPRKWWKSICNIPDGMSLWAHIENNLGIYSGLDLDNEYIIWDGSRTTYRMCLYQSGESRTLRIFPRYSRFYTNEYVIHNGRATRSKFQNQKPKVSFPAFGIPNDVYDILFG